MASVPYATTDTSLPYVSLEPSTQSQYCYCKPVGLLRLLISFGLLALAFSFVAIPVSSNIAWTMASSIELLACTVAVVRVTHPMPYGKIMLLVLCFIINLISACLWVMIGNVGIVVVLALANMALIRGNVKFEMNRWNGEGFTKPCFLSFMTCNQIEEEWKGSEYYQT